MVERKGTILQLLDILEYQMPNHGNNSAVDTVRKILDSIPILLRMVFPADGVDNIKQTINGGHEAFYSASGHNFRGDSLTIFSSFLGLPNRQLYKDSYQSWRNLLENFTGGLNKSADKYIAIMIPLNTLLTLLRFVLNVVKLITEFIPALLFMATSITITTIFRNLECPYKNLLAGLGLHSGFWWISIPVFAFLLLSPLMIAPAILYLSGCCLTSSYESMRAAWHFGVEFLGKEWGFRGIGFVFVGIIIATTIVVNIFALPWALKFLTVTFLPRITPYLPRFIANGIDKIGAAIKPVLTVIGNVLAPIIKYSELIFPEFVGAGFVGAIVRSLISPIINYGIDTFTKWWHYNPKFADKSDILSQQSEMLCDLGAEQEEQPAIEMHETLNIINEYIPHGSANNINGDSLREAELQLNPEADNPAQPLLYSERNNSAQPARQSHEEINGKAANYSLKPPSSASSSLFPPENSLKPPASTEQSQTGENVVETISRTPSPSG